ncbi:hypothetical protein N0V82_005123 [Gnomoniopsis sp. IMI 355080]|nr:hypothetical protein N0V82_005123 [Gnomoniopsis sp. IMI 355080]
MTSVSRQRGNIYADIQEPKYSIMSYTWGRYTVPSGPSLGVKGVSWPIPAIDEARFQVADFERVLKKAGQSNRFVWVDIACIDQEDHDAKMKEVGRQAGIFANADRAYIWLWTLPLEPLQRAIDTIVKYGFNMPEVIMDDGTVPEMASALSKAIPLVLDDFWFSSLWTLQEGFLREDAILLSPIPT